VTDQLTFDGQEVPHEGNGDRADPRKLGYVGSISRSNRDSDAWFTPEKYLVAVRKVLGGTISLDPFSSAEANKVVKAEQYFTEKENAFKREWFSSKVGDSKNHTVWMNPPYGGGLVSDAVNLFLNEYAEKSFSRGIILVNNATETKWFQRALSVASALTLTDHRISFWNSDGKAISGNTRGQAFLYFGETPEDFIQTFSAFGFSCPLPSVSDKDPSFESDNVLPLDF